MTARPRTAEENAARGFYPEYMTDACRGCTSTGGHYPECPRYGDREEQSDALHDLLSRSNLSPEDRRAVEEHADRLLAGQEVPPRLPVPLADATGQLDVDTMRKLAPEIHAGLIDSLRLAAFVVRSTRGTVVAAEDTYDLVRRVTAAGEVLRMWRDAFEAAAKEADSIAEEEALTAMGEADGIPLGSLFVPDGVGQRITVRADYGSGSDAWDLDSMKGWLAEDTVAELGLGDESDRPVLTVQEVVSVVRDALDRLTSLGRFSPSVTAVKALRTRLAERGRDADAAVLGQLRTTGSRIYKGVKITREETK